jgi:hypothetical protein
MEGRFLAIQGICNGDSQPSSTCALTSLKQPEPVRLNARVIRAESLMRPAFPTSILSRRIEHALNVSVHANSRIACG